MAIKEQALRIIDKVVATGKAYAVFVMPNGVVKISHPLTNGAQELMAKKPQTFMGVYDKFCPTEVVEGDLACMGIK